MFSNTQSSVMAAITADQHPVQGCRVRRLGVMRYRPVAAPAFVERWFPDGVDADALGRAPVVVFDRVRENFRSLRVDSMEVLNRSINQTLSRTVITAVMFFLSALALYLYGGASMEGLAETHMIGAVIVVLSSILVAVPMLTIGFLRVSKQDLLPKAKDVEALARRP